VLGRPETLAAALRRSLPLIVLIVLIHVAMVNAYVQLQGARYAAESSVLLTTEDIGNIITNTQPVFVDPERLQKTGVALASSPELFERTARRTGGAVGSGDDLDSVTEVSADNDILTFKVTTDDPEESVSIANRLAAEYRRWRTELQGDRIQRALIEVRRQLRGEPSGSARRPDLRQQINDLEVLARLNTGNTVPVEAATVAKQVSPAPLRDSLVGAALGLLIALLVVVAREAIDTKVRSEDDVEELLQAPVLASVPRLPRRARLVMFGRREHEFGDIYALLAASVLQEKTSRSMAVAITSSVAQEGKTTTAANLAVALARRGNRVVVADFDTRKPSLGELFRLPRDAPGVAHVLRGSAQLGETMWSVSLNGMGPMPTQQVEPDAVTGDGAPPVGSLQIIPAGGVLRATSAAELAGLESILHELKRGTDIVLCDTSPALLTVETTELSKFVDHVVIVVRHGHVTRRALRSLGRQVHGWQHTKLVGAVVTDAPLEEQMSYYYGKRA
jgi:polysaccharide biosynthesis transport protein